MSRLTVAKFGGTSMATPHSFRVVAEQIKRREDARVIVVSAPGKITAQNNPGSSARDSTKITDRLLHVFDTPQGEHEAIADQVGSIAARYQDIALAHALTGETPILSSPFADAVYQRLDDARLSRNRSSLAALGEEMNAKLLTAVLNQQGIGAVFVDPKDAGFIGEEIRGAFSISDSQYLAIRQTVLSALESGRRVIIPGFYGYTSSGEIRTFARGGSDYTAAVLAASLGGIHVNFTDTDGVRVVEDTIDRGAPVIRTMSHHEIAELTLGGKFGILQNEAVVPLAVNKVPTLVLDTFDSNSAGTVIETPSIRDNPIAGLVHRGEYVSFELLKYGIANEVGFFERLTRILVSMGVSIEHIPSSTNSVSIIVRKSSLESAGVSKDQVRAALQKGLNPLELRVQDISEVAIVGEGLGTHAGLGMRIFSAIAKFNVIKHFHESISLVLWFSNGDALDAAKALYNELFNNQN